MRPCPRRARTGDRHATRRRPHLPSASDSIELSGRRLGTMAELETELRDMLAARSDHTSSCASTARSSTAGRWRPWTLSQAAGAERIGLVAR